MPRKILTSCLSIVFVISFTFGLINSAIALQNKDTSPSVEITKQETLSPRKKQECDPNYSGACIPVYPPDIDYFFMFDKFAEDL